MFGYRVQATSDETCPGAPVQGGGEHLSYLLAHETATKNSKNNTHTHKHTLGIASYVTMIMRGLF